TVRRRAIEIVGITALLLVLVPLIASLIPEPGSGSRTSRASNPFSDQRQANPYWGFQDQLDTSVRGDLGDEVVMRVQAPAPDLWRGTTYDHWAGRTWTKTTSPPRGFPGYGDVVVRPAVGDPATPPGSADFTQVVTVEKAGSDLVFGAYRASEVAMDEPAT